MKAIAFAIIYLAHEVCAGSWRGRDKPNSLAIVDGAIHMAAFIGFLIRVSVGI